MPVAAILAQHTTVSVWTIPTASSLISLSSLLPSQTPLCPEAMAFCLDYESRCAIPVAARHWPRLSMGRTHPPLQPPFPAPSPASFIPSYAGILSQFFKHINPLRASGPLRLLFPQFGIPFLKLGHCGYFIFVISLESCNDSIRKADHIGLARIHF